MTLLFAFLIGLISGLRSLTPVAVTAWATRMGWLKVQGTLSLIGSLPSVIIFTVLALTELIMDKLPKTPPRTSPPGLISRIVMGALAGACIASAGGQAALVGALLGAVGGVIGCYGGYRARIGLVKALGTPDIFVALFEDLITIAASLWIVSRF